MGTGAVREAATTPENCEAVLSEVILPLHRAGARGEAVPRLIERGVLRVAPVLTTEAAEVAALMRKYAALPMSLAGACLVRLSELIPHAVVFTLDTDFQIYRRRGRAAIPLLTAERD